VPPWRKPAFEAFEPIGDTSFSIPPLPVSGEGVLHFLANSMHFAPEGV
jgi:hypothetical protein